MMQDLFLRRLELVGPELEFVPGKIQIVGAVDRYQVHMRMRYFEADHGDATTITGKSFLYRLGDGPGKYQDLAEIICGQVEEFIDLDLGYYQRMSLAQREDIQERKELIVFGYLICGDLSGYDL